MSAVEGDWKEALSEEFKKPYYRRLYETVKEEYHKHIVYPPSGQILNALNFTPLLKVKVVIIGQDPYHEKGQANGLAFSVGPDVAIPPSLLNIYKELHDDLGLYIPDNGCLEKWARQGVLLLNNVLTVRAHKAYSHQNIGWEQFTDAVFHAVEEEKRPLVYMLWGSHAAKKASLVKNPSHLVLTAPHPSPLSAYRGFFGCRHFSKCNSFLEENKIAPIDWQIENRYNNKEEV